MQSQQIEPCRAYIVEMACPLQVVLLHQGHAHSHYSGGAEPSLSLSAKPTVTESDSFKKVH